MTHPSLSPPGANGPYFPARRVNRVWNVFSQSAADSVSLNDTWIIINFCSALKLSMTSVCGSYSLVMGRDIMNGTLGVSAPCRAPGRGPRHDTPGTARACSGVMPNLNGPQPSNVRPAVLPPGVSVAAFAAASVASSVAAIANIVKARMLNSRLIGGQARQCVRQRCHSYLCGAVRASDRKFRKTPPDQSPLALAPLCSPLIRRYPDHHTGAYPRTCQKVTAQTPFQASIPPERCPPGMSALGQ